MFGFKKNEWNRTYVYSRLSKAEADSVTGFYEMMGYQFGVHGVLKYTTDTETWYVSVKVKNAGVKQDALAKRIKTYVEALFCKSIDMTTNVA